MRFLRATRRYYRAKPPPTAPDDDGATSRDATAVTLARYTDKVIRCRRAADIRAAMEAIGFPLRQAGDE